MFKLFDSHCHLQLSQFDADRDAVLARMQEKEMGAVVIGTDFKESREGVELAEQYDFLWASVGLHPTDNVEEEFDVTAYQELAADPKVVAIGECGLDYFHLTGGDAEKAAQKKRFEAQIELALTVQKPLIIHCRNAHEDMLEILKDYMGNHPDLRMILHFFTGTGELAQKYLDLGCHLSFPGPITYTDMYDESIRVCPLERLLIETDSPFAAPLPNRGKRNEPAFVAEVAKKVAKIKGISPDQVGELSFQNAKAVFGLA
jgi:TatD DNase family protein